MVLQRQQKLPVWGSAEPGEKVTVKLAGQGRDALAGANGRWVVKLDELQAGGPHEMTIAGKNTIVLKDVLVGEVWLCSGQSNMVMKLAEAAGGSAAAAKANHPKIRLFTVPDTAATKGSGWTADWQPCTPETAAKFSATAYYFGRDLHAAIDCPLGLIVSAVNGSKADEWTSREGFAANPKTKGVLDRYKQWLIDVENSKKPGAARKPGRFRAPPATLFDPMMAPLQPYGIRGVIWYQGESVTAHAPYSDLFANLITSWRREWGIGDFPFLFVQIAPLGKAVAAPAESGLAVTREQQLQVMQSVANTAMAVITDAGHATNVHPPRKEPVGQRLALAALALAYGRKDVVYCGPIYAGMRIDAGKAVLSFTHVGTGLLAKDGLLRGFAIAPAEGPFVNASAEITGNTVVVWSDKVAIPAAVRYAWAENPEGANLYNKEGLPASPFRTDTLPQKEPVR